MTNPIGALEQDCRWAEAANLLSLDVVEPFHEHMGLFPHSPDALCALFRRTIIATRKGLEDAATQEPGALTDRILHDVEFEFGPTFRADLNHWQRQILSLAPTNNLKLHHWTAFLRECRHHPEHWGRLDIPPAMTETFRGAFLTSIDVSDVFELSEQHSDQRLSDWDLQMYALHLYNDEPMEGINNGPGSTIVPTVRNHRSMLFWQEVCNRSDTDALMTFWRSALDLAASAPEAFGSVDLVHPNDIINGGADVRR